MIYFIAVCFKNVLMSAPWRWRDKAETCNGYVKTVSINDRTVHIILKYSELATFSRNWLDILVVWFCTVYCLRDMKIYPTWISVTPTYITKLIQKLCSKMTLNRRGSELDLRLYWLTNSVCIFSPLRPRAAQCF